MEDMKTKAIENIERKMEDMDEGSIRYRVLDNAKNFKTSWIELAQALYTVWRDKLYKEWGYQEFDNYVTKEIGIHKQTAVKLLRSYSFLEKEEPRYLMKEYNKEAESRAVPTYEAVDVLRQASSNKNLDREDYSRIKKYVLKDGKDAKEVKKELTEMIRKNEEELDPEEAREKKREAVVKRFVGTLKAISREIKMSKLLPARTIEEVERLIEKIEAEIE
ncbi:MAG: hypothetical protein ABH883_06110 [Candidatus Omnitrophota bacterium]